MNTTTTYLALYTGPGGPVSKIFEAEDLEDACAIVESQRDLASGSSWYDRAEDAIGIDSDGTVTEEMQAEIDTWIDDNGWTIALRAESDSEYEIYSAVTR